jgi:hypothetical protein
MARAVCGHIFGRPLCDELLFTSDVCTMVLLRSPFIWEDDTLFDDSRLLQYNQPTTMSETITTKYHRWWKQHSWKFLLASQWDGQVLWIP